jgi:hypothetical protein
MYRDYIVQNRCKKIKTNSFYRDKGDGSEAQGPNDHEEMAQHHHAERVVDTSNKARTQKLQEP